DSCSVPLDSLAEVARSEAPLAEYDAGPSNPIAEQIVEHLLRLIPNGATIQIGIGKIPARLVPRLVGHRDIAFHSGMLSDALLDIATAPALRPGRSLVSGVVVGSAKLYARLGAVQGLCVAGVGMTHDAA